MQAKEERSKLKDELLIQFKAKAIMKVFILANEKNGMDVMDVVSTSLFASLDQ